MDFLQSKGVQMMLQNIVKAAAPELVEKVSEISAVIIAFKDQLDRIEARQLEIVGRMNDGYRGGNQEIAGSIRGVSETPAGLAENNSGDRKDHSASNGIGGKAGE
jgi:hypothetical protein